MLSNENSIVQWIEAETRCATIESEVRQQVAKETETELKRMEDIYMSFLKKEVKYGRNFYFSRFTECSRTIKPMHKFKI